MRKIVMLPSHEWLMGAFRAKQMDIALDPLLSQFQTDGVQFSPDLYPVQIPYGHFSFETYSGVRGDNYMVVADFESEAAENEFLARTGAQAIYADPQIDVFPIVAPSSAVGTDTDVLNKLNIQRLHQAGSQGRGVKLVIVDSGIDGTQINVAGGFNPRPGIAPGTAQPGHGTMVAYDALIAASNAIVYDYPLLWKGGGWVAYLSDAIRAFSEILITHLQSPGPMVVVNSWGMYSTNQDAPTGHPQNYSQNPSHPFNQIVSAVVGSGVDVLFAAGNCGQAAPDSRCGAGDIGPAYSIHGANSHSDIISVAAVTVNDDLLGYSSEGPGKLNASKPDICGFSHFQGSGVASADTGTSAACPVVAGVVAALRSTPQGAKVSPATLKQHLLDYARSTHGPGWSPQYGWGIVDADASYATLP